MTIGSDQKITKIKELMTLERIEAIEDEATRERVRWTVDQAAKLIAHTPLEEMDPFSLQMIFNALDHCESR
jgi:hypothetical protein